MNGIEATEAIMAFQPTPILIVSSSVHDREEGLAFEAVSAGALDVLEKPDPDVWEEFAGIGNELIRKVKLLSSVKVITHVRGKRAARAHVGQPILKRGWQGAVVAIGASTGGPQAVSHILRDLPAGFPLPIVVAQHIAEGFVEGLVSWLSGLTKLAVKVGDEYDELEPGNVYIAPTSGHLLVQEPGVIRMIPPKDTDTYRPSIDLLLSTVAETFKASAIGVLLTGMGSDGAKGLKRIRDFGGYTIAQDEDSSTVFGMPKAAQEIGAAKEVLPVGSIASRLEHLVGSVGEQRAV